MKIDYKGRIIETNEPVTIKELLKKEIEESEIAVVAATFNNEYKGLDYIIKEDGKIELIDISSSNGIKVYRTTLTFIAGKAFEKICPDKKMNVNYQLANAMFYDADDLEINDEFIEKMNYEMHRIVEQDLQIKHITMNREEAINFYKEKQVNKGRLQIDLEKNDKIYMYFCEDYYNYCYGILADRTGCVKIFKVEKYGNGFIVRYPSIKNIYKLPEMVDTKKLAWALEEYEDIHRILNVNTVYKLNQTIKENRIEDIIMVEEALHEKKIANMADIIAKNRNIKMVLIAGPSSSGKTTFAQRLGIQLRLNALKPVTISVDNYFVERSQNPKNKNGEYDFECIEAIDLELFNNHLIKILNGEEIEMPEFDFHEGTKKYNGKKLKLENDEILVIEGIHCLNDKLTSRIPKEQKYKIYISALTVLNMDRFNRISTTDTRLMRRIVRDYQFRGYSAKHTIKTWENVNNGEKNYIFPYQEEANSIFNTSLIYEIGVLKPVIVPLLEEINKDEYEYAEARRILEILKYFEEIPAELVPRNSLLKEFLGGGGFKY